MRKTHALAGLTIIGASLAVAVPNVAAHGTVATPKCGSLSWAAHDYATNETNSIVVKIDGATVHSSASFGAADSGSTAFSKTASHTWSVVVDAPGTAYDFNLHGEIEACETAPTTTTTVAPTTTTTTTVAPTTTVAETTTTLAPTTTIADAPTTAAAAVVTTVATPTTQTPRAIGVTTTQLPGTGRNVDPILAVAFMLVAGGYCLLRMRRRVA